MKIALHDNALSLRGTTVALYDYAYWLKHLYNIECIILYNQNHRVNNEAVKHKFTAEFELFGYNNVNEIDSILSRENCDSFFMIKGGEYDGVISNVCKNLVMAVSAHISTNNIHGDKFFVCSKWLKDVKGIDYVPHMISLPEVEGDMRNELNIPIDAVVLGRNGGHETFDLPFVKNAIRDVVNNREDIYFLFQNTDKFIEHERVIFLPPSPDMNEKVRFINTCDAHLHAREIGESFGLTCGEFSSKNKRVITWNGSKEINHIGILGDKGIYYSTQQDIYDILLNIKQIDSNIDVNCYREYTPKNVMEIFIKKYEIEI